MTGTDREATSSGTGIYLYCIYWLFGILFPLVGVLLSLDIVRRALDLPQRNMPYSLLGLEAGGTVGCVEGMTEVEGVGI